MTNIYLEKIKLLLLLLKGGGADFGTRRRSIAPPNRENPAYTKLSLKKKNYILQNMNK